jgi:hypothetical protein
MKNSVFLTAMLAVLAAPGVALSQKAPAHHLAANGNSPNMMHGNGSDDDNFHGAGVLKGGTSQSADGNEEQFQHLKTELIQRLYQRLDCVKLANDNEALQACMLKAAADKAVIGERRSGGNESKEQN